MLTSLVKLLENLKKGDNKIFDESMNHDVIKNTLAVLMVHIIQADKQTTAQEQKKIVGFSKDEFEMTDTETKVLFESVVSNMPELEIYVEKLGTLLAEDRLIKAKIIGHLNNLIICDGCKDEEYHVFETIKNTLLK